MSGFNDFGDDFASPSTVKVLFWDRPGNNREPKSSSNIIHGSVCHSASKGSKGDKG